MCAIRGPVRAWIIQEFHCNRSPNQRFQSYRDTTEQVQISHTD